MMRSATVVLFTAMASVLAACGDKPQTLGTASKQDQASYNGTESAYVATGWKAGDKASWESHLKARMQNSQNDSTKAN